MMSRRITPARPGGPMMGPGVSSAEARRRAERTIVRGSIVCVLIVLTVLIVTVVWPRVSFSFSAARPVVDTLSASSTYVGEGVRNVDTEGISEIVGTRPVAMVALTGDDPLAAEPLDTCGAVVDQLPDLIVQVVVDGEFANGCEGDDLRYGSGVTRSSWDMLFWLEHGYATSLVTGDYPELARQLALAYDAEVTGGRVVGTPRAFHPPPNRTAIAAGVVVGVIVGVAMLFVLLRLLTRWGFAWVDRRRSWDDQWEEIDAELGNIAMIMVGVDAGRRSDRDRAAAMGAAAADYSAALADLRAAKPGDGLDSLAERVRTIRRRIEVGTATS